MRLSHGFIPVLAVLAATLFVAGAAAGGNGSTVLTANGLASGEYFIVNGVSTLYFFTCNEVRVQKPDGSANESASCQLDPGQTPPTRAAHGDYVSPAANPWISDFENLPGFAGNVAATEWHGVVTPSGHVSIAAKFGP